MANANVIRQFLVSLGWDVDTAGMNRFANSIAVQTEAVHTLAEGLKAAAEKVVGLARDVASSLDTLYFASVKTKSSAANLDALRYAAEQTGISYDALKGNIQSLANFITYKPGADSWLHKLGVDAKDATGKTRDTVEVFRDLAAALDQPRYKQNKLAFLQFLGIDPQVFEAVTSGKFDQFFREHQARAKAMGVNQNKDAGTGNDFETQMRRIRDQIGLFEEGTLAPLLSRALPYIEKFVNYAGTAIQKLIAWWDHLGPAAKTAIKWALAIAAALAALAVGFTIASTVVNTVANAFQGLIGTFVKLARLLPLLATLGEFALPILAVAAAIAAVGFAAWKLYQDFQSWRHGGESWFPWQSLIDGCETLTKRVGALAGVFMDTLKPVLSDVWSILKDLFTGNWSGLRKQAADIGDHVKSGWQQSVAAATGHIETTWANQMKDKSGSRPATGTLAENEAFLGGLENKFGLAPGTLDKIWAIESSRGQDTRTSSAGAQGPFQFTRQTATAYGLQNPQDFQESATAAARYLADLQKRFGGDADKMVAAYNWGPGNVAHYGLGRMPSETANYLRKFHSIETPTITQHITTTVTGAADPQGVSQAVTGAMGKSNGVLLRSLRNANS